MKEHTNYPSAFAIDEKVTLQFFEGRRVFNCKVRAVKFTRSKVFYDIGVPLPQISGDEEQISETIIENVDSVFVETHQEVVLA